jgi:transglutaminase-like putative cysteine protease
MRRDFNLEGRPPGSGLRLRIPLPYDDPAQEDLRIETSVPSGDQVLVRRARESLEVRMPESSAPLGELTLGVDVTARVHQVRRPVDAGLVEPYDRVSADYALYTRSTEGLIQLTPEVRRAAAEAAGRLENPWLVVEAIWDWLCDRMILNTVHLTELDPVDPLGWVLRHRWCDCFVGSALFVALCRARGLPARVVGGVCLYSAIGFSHYWAEVLIPPFGWVPMDTTSWSLAAGEGSASPWAMFFRGRIDYRLRMECWPKVVTGPIGIKYPAEWYLVQTFERGETVVTYHEVPTGRWLYRDRLRVKLAPAPV